MPHPSTYDPPPIQARVHVVSEARRELRDHAVDALLPTIVGREGKPTRVPPQRGHVRGQSRTGLAQGVVTRPDGELQRDSPGLAHRESRVGPQAHHERGDQRRYHYESQFPASCVLVRLALSFQNSLPEIGQPYHFTASGPHVRSRPPKCLVPRTRPARCTDKHRSRPRLRASPCHPTG